VIPLLSERSQVRGWLDGIIPTEVNTIADIETLYALLGERDYEAVMSYLTDDIVWIVADNSPFADRSPYHGIAEVRSGIFDRLTAGFDKLVFDADEIFECSGGERVVALGYYYFRFHGQAEERKAQVAHVWTIRDGRAVKFQQYLDTLQVARDSGVV
jgi:ketosteroid isomerase-like protein